MHETVHILSVLYPPPSTQSTPFNELRFLLYLQVFYFQEEVPLLLLPFTWYTCSNYFQVPQIVRHPLMIFWLNLVSMLLLNQSIQTTMNLWFHHHFSYAVFIEPIFLKTPTLSNLSCSLLLFLKYYLRQSIPISLLQTYGYPTEKHLFLYPQLATNFF